MIDKKLVSVLNTLEHPEVYFGPQGFKHITSINELTKAQLGFGVNAVKSPVTSDNTTSSDGDWQASWLVFARDTELGDPYFIDVLQPELPVYTGFLGDAGWEKTLVAQTLDGYILCMQLLTSCNTQKQAQFIPDESSIADAGALENLQQALSKASGAEYFWQMFIQCYQDWLIEE